jgi:phosphoribosylglycinamide formyltransferase 2
MSQAALEQAHAIASTITNALGGQGIFGVELFVKGDKVWFSEVSPRPHDTGLVTLVSQDLSEFALHVRAILGLPVPAIRQLGPSASCVLLAEGDSEEILFDRLQNALAEPDTDLRLFGKPEVHGKRRMGVCLARAETVEEAREKARKAAAAIAIRCN